MRVGKDERHPQCRATPKMQIHATAKAPRSARQGVCLPRPVPSLSESAVRCGEKGRGGEGGKKEDTHVREEAGHTCALREQSVDKGKREKTMEQRQWKGGGEEQGRKSQ